MIAFANLALMGGLLAVAAPILLHIAHRRRFQRQPWGAMRFLVDVAVARKRRLQVDHWLLLSVRCTMLACLALALMRPIWSTAGSGPGLEREGAVAAVLMIDDSLSASAGRGSAVFTDVQDVAESYLATLGRGDEISVILGSRRGEAVADPLFAVDAVRDQVAKAAPTAVASDMAALIEAGLAQLSRHVNPHAELVIVTDGFRDGWRDLDGPRWRELRRRLTPDEDAGGAPRIVILQPAAAPSGINLAITDVRVDRTLIPVGREVGIRVRLASTSGTGVERVVLRISVNGRPVAERAIEITAATTRDEVFSHIFSAAGSHVVEARVEGARDLVPGDDARAVAVRVESGVDILLVEGDPGQSEVYGSLGLVAAALDPTGDGSGLFRVHRRTAGQFDRGDLEDMRVVILGDVPALEPATVAALEAFIVAGGGVLVGLGPQTDIALANRFWARGGHGFLPAALGHPSPVSGTGQVQVMSSTHAALAPFAEVPADAAWQSIRVRRHVPFLGSAAQLGDFERLLVLDDGEPLLILRRRGRGQVALFGTTLDTRWTDLPRHAAFVPLLYGVVADLAAAVLPPRNLRPGDRLSWIPPVDFAGAVDLAGPEGTGVPLSEGTWEGRRAYYSPPVMTPGGYHLRAPGVDLRFSIAADPAESALEPVTSAIIQQACGPQATDLAGTTAVTAAFDAGRYRAVELWRWLIALCVLLLFVESLLTWRSPRSAPGAA